LIRFGVALRTALVFALFGALWVLLSDVALSALVRDPGAVTRLQTVKGWAFVAAASGLVYALAARVSAAEQRERELLQRRSAELVEAQRVARVGHWVFDPAEGGFRCSQELYRILGIDEGNPLTYQRFLEAAEPDHSERLANARHRLRSGGAALQTVYPIRHPSGEVRWVQEKVTRQPSRAGEASRLTGSVADVTELVESARELEGRNHLLERTFETVEEGVLLQSADRIIDCNASACRLLGYERSELVGRDPAILELRADRRGDVDPTGQGGSARAWVRRQSGSSLACEVTIVPLPEDQGVEGGQIIVLRRIAEGSPGEGSQDARRRGEERRREEERRRMAEDLRDGVARSLERVGHRLEGALQQIPGGALRSDLEATAASLNDTLGDIRHLASELRPEHLDGRGLVRALEWLSQEADRRWGIACTFSTDGWDLPIDVDRAILVYRIVEEALTNTSRHAPGSSASVAISHRNREIRFQVEDDGSGFDPDAPRSAEASGLAGMRERAAILGARLTVEPREPSGTRVSLELPA